MLLAARCNKDEPHVNATLLYVCISQGPTYSPGCPRRCLLSPRQITALPLLPHSAQCVTFEGGSRKWPKDRSSRLTAGCSHQQLPTDNPPILKHRAVMYSISSNASYGDSKRPPLIGLGYIAWAMQTIGNIVTYMYARPPTARSSYYAHSLRSFFQQQVVGQQLIPRHNQSPISLFVFSQGASNFRAPGNQSPKYTSQSRNFFSNISGEIGAATGPTATAVPATWN